MIYLHCGWPKTGTTSLQTALAAKRDLLEVAGVVYPERWTSPMGAHNGLAKQIRVSPESFALEVRQALTRNSCQRVVFSAEIVTALVSRKHKDSFLRFLSALCEWRPVKCIWTLRRVDEFLGSLYPWSMFIGLSAPEPEEYPDIDLDSLFAGVMEVEDRLDGNFAYVKYDPKGKHQEELLRAFDLPVEVRRAVLEAMEKHPRRNPRPTHKQVLALQNLDLLSARLGVELDRRRLIRAFRCGDLAFANDRGCELMTTAVRAKLHERGLAVARRMGLTRYDEFFAGSQVQPTHALTLDLDALDDRDLSTLATFAQTPSAA